MKIIYMNYASFIVKIIEKPTQIFFDNGTLLTQFIVQIPEFKNKSKCTIVHATIWGKLGYDITQYYQINDYIIVEGYLSIRENLNSEFNFKTFKKAEISIYKIYPFLL
uniref:Single-stranded DNA binding protein n=1 Tax=Psammoneis obaidii TaxID=1706219 RepID=A0A2U9NS93_9STRA|nr:hypothetical protein ycf41 [Psammoneis obaidii]AWT39746.1 hypothetical protein ycf41 [Psammoneis obaidii]